MTTKEIREKDDSVLNAQLAEHRRHIFDIRTQSVTEKVEDVTQIRKSRKDIARILTILNERRRAAAKK